MSVPRFRYCLVAALLFVTGTVVASETISPGSGMLLSVQLPDNYVANGKYVATLPFLKELGVGFIRVDMNWPAVETARGVYDWEIYDTLSDNLQKTGLRPIFILNRPNMVAADEGARPGVQSPSSAATQRRFGQWAAAAALRYKKFSPVWEIWNEPDLDSFWPPSSDPEEYVSLALVTCLAVRASVSDAVIVGPAAARMPTVWKSRSRLWDRVAEGRELTQCLSGISFHTHRFKQKPETVLRDYAAFQREYPGLWSRAQQSGIYITEWGDSVVNGGISEKEQAIWLVRMMLLNAISGIKLTNYYCLIDTGDNPNELEDRFGLLTADLRRRPAFFSFAMMIANIRGKSVVKIVNKVSKGATGSVSVIFCDAGENECLMAAWGTDKIIDAASGVPDGWKAVDAGTDFLGTKRLLGEVGLTAEGLWVRVSRIGGAARGLVSQ